MDYIPKRIFIKLRPEESQALAELAEQEQREPREQAALLIRRQLEMEAMVESLPELDLACPLRPAVPLHPGVEKAIHLVHSVRILIMEAVVEVVVFRARNKIVGNLSPIVRKRIPL